MNVWKIILFSIAGAIIVGFVAGMIIGNVLKKRKDPDYKPVLSKKQASLCFLSAAIGIGLILTGVFLPNKSNQENVLDEFTDESQLQGEEFAGDDMLSEEAQSEQGVSETGDGDTDTAEQQDDTETVSDNSATEETEDTQTTDTSDTEQATAAVLY